MEVGQVPEPSQAGIGDPVNGQSRGGSGEVREGRDVSGGGELEGPAWRLRSVPRGAVEDEQGSAREDARERDLVGVPGEVAPNSAIGYEVADALERYQCQHGIEGVLSFKQFLQYAESEASMPISLVSLEDSSSLDRMFLCCYVDTRVRVYDFKELMAVIVPPQFTRLKEVLGMYGDLKRVFAPKGIIFSYDVDGKTRVKEECLIGVPVI
ncbi:hypothetical protein B0F90DRAFT_1919179 [Multifurca ochricompacta]|uniref:Uncharacterized protein n=1 Tax=Multifurca ochricompacta TaxID=376703 RepID=A0AAD4M1C2_9AGAM|nr:hypothetical protein B0F90DRAFT_1919179 [Multifurca ochricompacta]